MDRWKRENGIDAAREPFNCASMRRDTTEANDTVLGI